MKEEGQLKHIVLKSRELFMRNGIKNLTMDQIAKDLGMSKKTIYQFVENKSELVQLTLQNYLEEERGQMENVLKNPANSVDEMIKMIAYLLGVLQGFQASAMTDLQKYYPEAWRMYDDYRTNFMLGRIKDNLSSGVTQGYYRNDLNTDIIARIYVLAIELLINQELFPASEYEFSKIYSEFLNYHLRGIVSLKGLNYLEEHNLFKG